MKKFLSLALALVMTMSLVTISAGAKDFTDDSKIAYDEAVAVISEIGVVDGYSDGSFNPQNTLTRGAAAKIICNLVLGPTTASALSADAAPFSDVPATHEFAGYIAYCSQQGIINGYADGTFKPAGTLTGYQFMKMLLGALGYDGEIEGFTGANWTVNVAKLALGVGLDDGNDEFSGNAYVTREEACLYAFNTLQADMVEYDSKTSVSIGGAEVVIAGSKAQVADQGVYDDTMNAKGLQFAEKYFPKLTKTKNDTDPFGRPAAEWKYKSNVIGSYADTSDLLETYTAKAKRGDLYTLVGSSVVNDLTDEYDLTVYVDGAKVKDPTVSNYFNKNSSAAAGVSGNGVLTEVYMDDDNNVTIVQINTYLVKATDDYSSSKGTLTFEVVDINTDTAESDNPIDMPPLGNSIDNDDVNVESFKEDDYILVTYSYDSKAIESAELAEVVTGEVSEFTETDNVIIDGTTYKYNKLVGKEQSRTEYTIGEDAKVVLDEYGYILYIDEAISTSSYVYIESLASTENSKTVKLNAYFTDGTFGEITVKKVAGETGAAAMRDASGWYTFSKDSADKYTLSTVKNPLTTADATVSGAETVVTANGKVRFMPNAEGEDITIGTNESASVADIKGDSSTIFVVMDADDEVTTYTGVANVPDITTSAEFDGTVAISVVYKQSTGYAKYVFIDVSEDADAVIDDANSAADYLFLLKYTGNKTTSGEDTYYKYKVVLDGKETEKFVESSLVDGGDSNGTLFRNIKENSKGYVTKATVFEDAAKRDVVEMTKADGDQITFSGDTLTIVGEDYIIGDKCNVTLGIGKNAHADLIDEGNDYYLSQGSARSMANYLKNYNLTGTAYIAVDDDNSEVATDIYVWVSSATYVGPVNDETTEEEDLEAAQKLVDDYLASDTAALEYDYESETPTASDLKSKMATDYAADGVTVSVRVTSFSTPTAGNVTSATAEVTVSATVNEQTASEKLTVSITVTNTSVA
ncbi:S-layer homology domain-containing protein [Oscillibacter sp. PC13]|uniref:S-layer homology domain-containing protein n=1 Tax=Oscillibacter sp. PC13 TaxID=1855299 RepID=UPI0008F43BE4|nr:S-layer homology domain-containing protein [Oscillibacter sp. PC13]SFO96854.1 S-layer homology domain-containing protein [Oscillibacter sp. PC13]